MQATQSSSLSPHYCVKEGAMKIGVFEFAIDNSVDPAVLAKRAEELGFSSFWVPEHAIIPVKTTTPYPGSRDGIIPDAYGRDRKSTRLNSSHPSISYAVFCL